MSIKGDIFKAFACGAATVLGSVGMTKLLKKIGEPETKDKAKNILKKSDDERTETQKTEAE